MLFSRKLFAGRHRSGAESGFFEAIDVVACSGVLCLAGVGILFIRHQVRVRVRADFTSQEECPNEGAA